jgi:hypothetical protein
MQANQTWVRTNTEKLTLAVSLELATAKWRVALHDGQRCALRLECCPAQSIRYPYL